MPRFRLAAVLVSALVVISTGSGAVENGTRVVVSDYNYWTLISRLEAAIKKHKLRVVTRASVRGAARQRKLGIPGNMVIGAFNDKYAARVMKANVAAGIETPIRFYITREENAKTTTLWFRRPSWVLSQYDRNGAMQAVAVELDAVMEKIVRDATKRRPLMVKRAPKKRKRGGPKDGTTAVAAKPGKAKRDPSEEREPAVAPAIAKQATAGPTKLSPARKNSTANAAGAGSTGDKPKTATAAVGAAPPKPLAPAKPAAAKRSNGKPEQSATSSGARSRTIELLPLLRPRQGR